MSLSPRGRIAVLTTMLSANAQVVAADPPPSTDPTQLLKQLDTDKDGFVSKAEAEKLHALSRVFDESDANKDGKLDLKELTRALGMTPPK
jgi:Ca2+-binding EF-hand superfamily protein